MSAERLTAQKVSRRWQQVLSSQALCRAAVRATLGKDPWARDSNPKATSYANPDAHSEARPGVALATSSDSTPASTVPPDMPRSVPITSYSATSFTKFVRRRLRLERGTPYSVTRMPMPLDIGDSWTDPKLRITYSEGSCAWVEETGDPDSVVVLNLRNGNRTKFTTDNREELIGLTFAKPLIAAVSIRGYCHVWNIDTSQSSSFRLPSLDITRTLISGTKVVIQYGDSFVYWSFDTGLAREMKTGQFRVLALAPHPSEERITIVRLCPKDLAHHRKLRVEECQLQVAEYSLDSMTEISSRYQSFPKSAFPRPGDCLENRMDDWGIHNPSQGSTIMVYEREQQLLARREGHSTLFSVSVEPDGLVAFHTFPEVEDLFELTCPEQGLVYAILEEGVLISKARIIRSLSNSYVWYDYQDHSSVEVPAAAVLGDADFMVFCCDEDMEVWAMDEPDPEDEEVVKLMNEF